MNDQQTTRFHGMKNPHLTAALLLTIFAAGVLFVWWMVSSRTVSLPVRRTIYRQGRSMKRYRKVIFSACSHILEESSDSSPVSEAYDVLLHPVNSLSLNSKATQTVDADSYVTASQP
jgi:hypothetical protein